jgi:hypothetical protein
MPGSLHIYDRFRGQIDERGCPALRGDAHLSPPTARETFPAVPPEIGEFE